MTRRKVPGKTQAEILIQSRRRCSICFGIHFSTIERKGQIAHLDKDSSNSDPDNLVFLCFNHHDEYDSTTSQSKGYTIQEVKHHRNKLYGWIKNHIHSDDSAVTVQRENGDVEPKLSSELISEIRSHLDVLMPDYRVPDYQDVSGEWLGYWNQETMAPLLCKGRIRGKPQDDIALFVFSREYIKYRIVVLGDDEKHKPESWILEETEGRPQSRYVDVRPAGLVEISRIIWKHGGPKRISLDHPGIIVGTFESASKMYYWPDEEGEFKGQWLCD